MGINLLANPGVIILLMTVLVGAGMSLLGYKSQQRNLFSGGVILILPGIAQQIYELMQHFDPGSWAGLAIPGIVSIIVASMMESRGGNIKLRFVVWKAKLGRWEK